MDGNGRDGPERDPAGWRSLPTIPIHSTYGCYSYPLTRGLVLILSLMKRWQNEPIPKEFGSFYLAAVTP